MKTVLPRLLSPFLLLALGAPALAQDGDAAKNGKPQIVIEGHGNSRDVPCAGSSVGIYGAENTITLTGACGDVVIHGKGHEVRFEKAGDLAITGAEHKVTGGVATGLSIAGARNHVETTVRPIEGQTTVEVRGVEHSVKLTLGAHVGVDVSGVKNDVSWKMEPGVPDVPFDIGGALIDVKRAP